jgi:thiol-disulfide isomerase/thioredoxin
MGESRSYHCPNCGFVFECADSLFYLDFDSLNVEKVPLGMLAMNIIADKSVSGDIYKTYCKHCKSPVMLFVISRNKSKYGNQELIDFIQDNYDGNELVKVFFNIDDSNKDKPFKKWSEVNKNIECPKCKNEIPSIIGDLEECPIC